MTSKGLSVEYQEGVQETQMQIQSYPSSMSSESVLSDAGTSGYLTYDDDSLFGKVKRRPKHSCNCKRGDDSSSLLNTPLTETDATEICKCLGRHWQSLGRELKFSKTTLDDISDDKNNHNNEDKGYALLIKFIHQHGSDATKGWLVGALIEIKRRDIAEKLGYVASTTPEEQQFILIKKEGSFTVPDEHGEDVKFFTCRNIENGQLYLVKEVVGTGYEGSFNALKQHDTIADTILKALDVNGIVKAEKQRKENQKFKNAQEKIAKLLRGLRDIAISLENQERKEKRIQVGEQLLENEKLLAEIKSLGTGLLQLTGVVSRLEDPFPIQAQMYSFSLGLSATHKDLEERIKMLKEMVPRGEKLLGQIKTEKFEDLLRLSRNLGKEMKMREKTFMKCFQEIPLENQERSSSEPSRASCRYEADVPEIRRGNTQPGCERDLRALREEVAPPPDPMENEDESFA